MNNTLCIIELSYAKTEFSSDQNNKITLFKKEKDGKIARGGKYVQRAKSSPFTVENQ